MAISSHKKCFVCNRKDSSRKLHRINEGSIYIAYKKYKIIINKSARCCRIHMDEYFNLNSDQYDFIKTTSIKDQNFYTDITSIQNSSSGIFQDFRDVVTLGEEKCLLITGWCKKDFIRFCKYITSLNDSNGRTLEECVAIYRYWLRKGIDQTSLAYTKTNTSQQHISHYLRQTRIAIMKDFVSFWLGASKSREFFCSHKNDSVISLHDLGPNDLVLIADGTYLRVV